jgi:hypothetical protein
VSAKSLLSSDDSHERHVADSTCNSSRGVNCKFRIPVAAVAVVMFEASSEPEVRRSRARFPRDIRARNNNGIAR